MSERCFFVRPDGECGALMDRHCAGINKKCSFYKTAEQYVADRNRAIKINRLKGNCNGCRYCGRKCEYEKPESVNEFGLRSTCNVYGR